MEPGSNDSSSADPGDMEVGHDRSNISEIECSEVDPESDYALYHVSDGPAEPLDLLLELQQQVMCTRCCSS